MPSSDWRPIETVPKDGRKVLVGRRIEIFGQRRICEWDIHIFKALNDPIREIYLKTFTHWCPIPEPPERESN